jgi:hypothetical protein
LPKLAVGRVVFFAPLYDVIILISGRKKYHPSFAALAVPEAKIKNKQGAPSALKLR